VQFIDKSDLSIMLVQVEQEAVTYTQETTSSPGLETKQRSSRNTSNKAGLPSYRRRSSKVVLFKNESDLSIMTHDVATYTQETTFVLSPSLETKWRISCIHIREAGQRRISREAVHVESESDLPIMRFVSKHFCKNLALFENRDSQKKPC